MTPSAEINRTCHCFTELFNK